jgi:hypothetical protein
MEPNQKNSNRPIDLRTWIPPVQRQAGRNVIDLRHKAERQDFYETLPASLPSSENEGVPILTLALLGVIVILLALLAGVWVFWH